MTTSPTQPWKAAATELATPVDFLTTRRSYQQIGLLSHPMCDALRRTWIRTLCCIDAGMSKNQNPVGALA